MSVGCAITAPGNGGPRTSQYQRIPLAGPGQIPQLLAFSPSDRVFLLFFSPENRFPIPIASTIIRLILL